MSLEILHIAAIAIIPLMFAITVHEVAHGWVAGKLGDKTATILGRITLNPSKHIDPIGTILVPMICIITAAPFLFGWAKPVPVNQRNLRKPREHMALVGFAGPASNLIMALLWAIPLNIILWGNFASNSHFAEVLFTMSNYGVQINLILALLNLLPLPPLDGGRILTNLLPYHLSRPIERIEPYGFIILLFLLASGVLGKLLFPLLNSFSNMLVWF